VAFPEPVPGLVIEVSSLRRVVEQRDVPDHTLTLGAIFKELNGARLTAIEDSPQLRATPASVAQHDRRIVWGVGGGAALVGAVLGTLLFLEVNRHAPDDWGWSAAWAAWLMQADTLQAGYNLMDRNNPGVAEAVNEDIRLGNAYAGELHKCEAVAAQAGKEQRCTLSVQPPPLDLPRRIPLPC
jgi:hypothetical protein